jgi:CheY-like chemotaxis protein
LNLVVNARDAMPAGGKLTIEASNVLLDEDYCARHTDVAVGQYVAISVTDNGTGMSKEVVEHAFEPFFTTKEAGKGTGLGLSQVYGFVKQSGGHIKIYSELGEGTTVRICMRRSAADTAVAVPARHVANEGKGSETILVVEDDNEVREFVSVTLRELGYELIEAPDAETALGFLDKHRIDLLLTDVVLPRMNGRQLVEAARQRNSNLKVLYMTGYSRNAIVHQGRLDPGVDLIQKPLTQTSLAERIRAVLDRLDVG